MKGRLTLAGIVVVATIVYGYILKLLGGSPPFVDALSTVVSVVAMIVSIKMYVEHCMLWIVVDIVTVFMWGVAFMNGQDSITTLLMWIIYLGNAVIMYFKWMKEAKEWGTK